MSYTFFIGILSWDCPRVNALSGIWDPYYEPPTAECQVSVCFFPKVPFHSSHQDKHGSKEDPGNTLWWLQSISETLDPEFDLCFCFTHKLTVQCRWSRSWTEIIMEYNRFCCLLIFMINLQTIFGEDDTIIQHRSKRQAFSPDVRFFYIHGFCDIGIWGFLYLTCIWINFP